MKKYLLALCSTIFLGFPGCGGGSSSDQRGLAKTPPGLIQGPITTQPGIISGFKGVAMATSPESLPGSIQFNREPVEGAELVFFIRGTSEIAAVVFTDANGGFSVELPPGDYLLVPREKTIDGQVFIAPSQILPLVPGRVTSINVEYESVVL